MSAVIPMELGAIESVFQASNFPLLLLVGVKRIACEYLEVIYAACVSKTVPHAIPYKPLARSSSNPHMLTGYRKHFFTQWIL
jgi:hypothetical protein